MLHLEYLTQDSHHKTMPTHDKSSDEVSSLNVSS